MKFLLLITVVSFTLACSVAIAGPAGNTRERAQKLELRVEADQKSGKISQHDADKYTKQLQHIIAAMLQNENSSERRPMWAEMDRIDAALDNAEGGLASPSPTP